MKIRIVSGGSGPSTKIINAATGEDIENVISAKWSCLPGDLAIAELTICPVDVDVIGEVHQKTITIGKIKRIYTNLISWFRFFWRN